MNRIIRFFRRMLKADEVTLTHVPVQTERASEEGIAADRARKDKLAAARAKFHKPFAIERRKPRETEPSIVLTDIERRAEQNNNRPTLIRVGK